MNRLCILDCTLRDGGYVNDFYFGEQVIINIIDQLTNAGIDIIECGFLVSGASDKNRALFGAVEQIKKCISNKNPNLLYVAMIQLGKIQENEISQCDGSSIDGIRLTFHEHEIDEAFALGKQLMNKGYKVFMQPVGTTTYTDASLLNLISRINELKPFAFYMVDTLGTMYKQDLLRMFYLVDHNLNKKIALGFHSHNNLQLSFANAQELMQLSTTRQLIIDSSVYGMGRGAGNLNTELMTQYINATVELRYDNLAVLDIIDRYIKPLSIKYKWGYDAAYYIASVTNSHPNYASYLMNLQTLRVQDIHAILSALDSEKKKMFNKELIREAYLNFMEHHVDDSEVQKAVAERINGRPVLLLAPGKSLGQSDEKIQLLLEQENYFVISVNFVPDHIPINLMFASNMKRFGNSTEQAVRLTKVPLIVITSNIAQNAGENILVADYTSYLNEEPCIMDNAGLMCINFLRKIGVKKILLAGFDGFSKNIDENYCDDSLKLDVEAEHLITMNHAIAKKMKQLTMQMDIDFLAESRYRA